MRFLNKICQNKKAQRNKKNFIISYPPGIPIYVPGEKFCDKKFKIINEQKSIGIEIFEV